MQIQQLLLARQMTMIKVEFDRNANKFIDKLLKRDEYNALQILNFIKKDLSNYDGDPRFMQNAKKLKGYNDERYRWRVGQYRIIGLVTKKEIFIVQVIKIAKRDDKTYKG